MEQQKEFRLDLDSGNIIDEKNKVWKVIPYIEHRILNDSRITMMLQRFEEFNFNIENLRKFYTEQEKCKVEKKENKKQNKQLFPKAYKK